MIIKDKRAQLGLGTVKVVMIAFLILTVIAFTIIITLTELVGVTDTIDRDSVNAVNETTNLVVNRSNPLITIPGTDGRKNCQLSIANATNATGVCPNSCIAAGNYTVVGCNLSMSTTSSAEDQKKFENVTWFITGTYTFSNQRTGDIAGNVSKANVSFFNSTGTIFAILVVVVIILAIGIIIAVVTRFGGSSSQTTGGSGGGKEFGSDTVMGI